MPLPSPTYTASFLGPGGNIQTMDLPSGVDLSAYFSGGANVGQALPLSALGQSFNTFWGSQIGKDWLNSPAGGQSVQNLWSLQGGVPWQSVVKQPPPISAQSALAGLGAAGELPQFLRGIGSLGSNFAGEGLAGAFLGLPAGALGAGGVTGAAGNVISSSAPEILRDLLPSVTGTQEASAATAGLIGSGGELGSFLPGLGAAASIGTGIADLVQGNIAGGAGSLGGAGLGAAIGSAVPGVGTLLGAAIGGGAGGFLGGLFGGGGPSKNWLSFPSRVVEGWNTYGTALQDAWNATQQATSLPALDRAVAEFNARSLALPGDWARQRPEPLSSRYVLYPYGPWLQSQSGTEAHGVALPTNQLGDAEWALRTLLEAKLKQLSTPQAATQQAAASPTNTSAPLGPIISQIPSAPRGPFIPGMS